ncbi:MAG: galactose ABC transporter substrate-binding protein [Lachnospiraceae bacterium]|nr:galactose ABC transporter substrate-binding protein [Lachnospiraceae bacterium]
MKKRAKKMICMAGICGVVLCVSGCGITSNFPGKEKKRAELKIGISVYDQYDTFLTEVISRLQSYAKEKEKDWNITITLEIQDANKSQLVQNDQNDEFIKRNFDVACINLVDRTDASTIIDKAKKADMPIIFFNRELVEEELERWDKLYYVGADAFKSGQIQGQILIEQCEKDFASVDRNGDGIIQYVMLEGEAGHQDSIVRSMYVIDEITKAGYKVEKLADEIANWSRSQAETKMTQFLSSYRNEIEVVFANNDDMALGAIDALKKELGTKREAKDNGTPWPYVLGIDGTEVGLEAVANGEMLGTVLNDGKGQAERMLDLAYSVVSGEPLSEEIELIDGKYIRLPYQKVTAENVAKIQWNMQETIKE